MSNEMTTTTPARRQRALERVDRFLARLGELRGRVVSDDLDALVELESLVLVARGSAENDHRQQLALTGLQAAADRYLVADAPDADAYATSDDPDALLAVEALREVVAEYPDDAGRMSVAEVAAAVRRWAAR